MLGSALKQSSKAYRSLYLINSKFISNGPKSLNLPGSSDDAHAASDLPQKLPRAKTILA